MRSAKIAFYTLAYVSDRKIVDTLFGGEKIFSPITPITPLLISAYHVISFSNLHMLKLCKNAGDPKS